jgi:hypothetical protein
MKKRNLRSLADIAAEIDTINESGRKNIFDLGDLLIEAKAQCEHGEWLDWLSLTGLSTPLKTTWRPQDWLPNSEPFGI